MIWSRNRGWIGVDVGTHTVKLAQLEKCGGQTRLADALVIRRSQAWQIGNLGSAAGPWESAQEIRAALSLARNFQGRDAAVALTMAVSDLHECELANRDGEARWDTVAEELKAVWGSTFDQRQLDFWHADCLPAESAAKTTVFAFSIRQPWATRIATDLSQSRLVGQVLDGMPLAIARAVELGRNGVSSEPVVAVDWGCQRASLCGVLSGQPHYVRCLPGAGFADILQRLCSALSLAPEEAQKVLSEHGLPNNNRNRCDDLQTVIQDVIAEPLSRFVEELTKTMSFLAQHRRGLQHSKVVLLGGGASIKNVAPYLAERLGLPVESWQPSFDAGPNRTQPEVPVELLGPAIALSSLRWYRE